MLPLPVEVMVGREEVDVGEEEFKASSKVFRCVFLHHRECRGI